MFGVGVGIRVGGFTPISGGGGFDPDAQAFFDRVTTAGGTLTTTEQNATNQLVLDMKSAGIWSAMKAIYPMVGASAAACAQNLKSSSFTGTFFGGVTFASTGVTGNGITGYMTTGFNPFNETTSSDGCLGYYSRTNNSSGGMAEIGAISSSPNPEKYFQIHALIGGTTYLLPNIASAFISFSNSDSSGFFQAFRTGTNSTEGRRNATAYTGSIGSATIPDYEAYVLARSLNGSANFFSDRQCAFAYFGTSITQTDAANYYTAVQAFQTTLSRNV
jgi:hypothetical protein